MGRKGKVWMTGIAAAAAATAVVASRQRKQKAQGVDVCGLDVDETLARFKDKVEELQILASNATAQPRENLKVTIGNVKGDAVAQAEQLRRTAERSKSKLSSELLRAQMNYEVKKEELEKEFEQKKYASQKVKDEAKAVRKAEDAEILMDFALEMVQQATAASLEATALAQEYKERYGEDIVLPEEAPSEEEETEQTAEAPEEDDWQPEEEADVSGQESADAVDETDADETSEEEDL